MLNELCAQVVKTRTKDCDQLKHFVQQGCAHLKIQVCVDKLEVSGSSILVVESSAADEVLNDEVSDSFVVIKSSLGVVDKFS